ncbi:hypothetical protein RM530_17665 [Algiphilus sp. W345]|uniref:Uncharacterized protein n=1 Tax=Banduia mediterranea TaxID=3075609 RepID=A0ABU2WMR3_9GAMM|nr:hypothetical protein [Algiphilus sp. W345]MDT0499174.1 hypothetical protein [Algiphilus sp. W345]
MNQRQPAPSSIAQAIVCGLCGWLGLQNLPLIQGGDIRWLPAMLFAVSAMAGIALTSRILLIVARLLDWLAAQQPKDRKNSVEWARFKDLKPEISKKPVGPFWGVLPDKPDVGLFIDFQSNAYAVAPSGTGKGINKTINDLLSVRGDKVSVDFKGEQATMLKRRFEGALRRADFKQLGNPPSAYLNLQRDPSQAGINDDRARRYLQAFGDYLGHQEPIISRTLLSFLTFVRDLNGGVMSAFYKGNKVDSPDQKQKSEQSAIEMLNAVVGKLEARIAEIEGRGNHIKVDDREETWLDAPACSLRYRPQRYCAPSARAWSESRRGLCRWLHTIGLGPTLGNRKRSHGCCPSTIGNSEQSMRK